ncbi:MAG: septum formation initiator family protein [Gemmatimonadaceae bacterium]|nr:septum formation initiator family protein [Gemmatimonadaceae bacterium]
MRGTWQRLVRIAIGSIVFLYAVQGGEYSTTALFSQRAREKRMRASMDSLRREIDSLARVKKAVQADPAVQERIAREEFGMVRGTKEILYRFAEPDSARKP